MPTTQVPDFTDLAARKLAELQANGYQITGYCFERLVEGSQPQRGFVDFGGFVGWWLPEQPGKRLAPYQRDSIKANAWRETPLHGYFDADAIIDAVESAHDAADMKGGQDVDA
jgi:hypothetical protein